MVNQSSVACTLPGLRLNFDKMEGGVSPLASSCDVSVDVTT